MNDPALTLPATVATIGLHGSASTWVFNIVREIMQHALGTRPLASLYADALSHLTPDARAARPLLIKSHRGDRPLDQWLCERNACIILSIRDPRDACLSMAQRFRHPLDRAATIVARDCERMLRLAPRNDPVLRYEDRPFDHERTVADLAGFLGLSLPPAVVTDLFARYRTEEVRGFAGRIEKLPPERLRRAAFTTMDVVTQIHHTHIGDAASGKWRVLPDPLKAALTTAFGPFLDRFGYPREA